MEQAMRPFAAITNRAVLPCASADSPGAANKGRPLSAKMRAKRRKSALSFSLYTFIFVTSSFINSFKLPEARLQNKGNEHQGQRTSRRMQDKQKDYQQDEWQDEQQDERDERATARRVSDSKTSERQQDEHTSTKEGKQITTEAKHVSAELRTSATNAETSMMANDRAKMCDE